MLTLRRYHLSSVAMYMSSASRLSLRRPFSYLSRHQTFPASLYKYQTQRGSALFDKSLKQSDWKDPDEVELSTNGLIHPKITTASNGAHLMPNTHHLQELAENWYEYYLENGDSRKGTAKPHFLYIPKGTAVPDTLTLYRDWGARFSLQPAHAMTLDNLNETLSQFYLDSGRIFDAGEWLNDHPWHEAYFDHEEEWMKE